MKKKVLTALFLICAILLQPVCLSAAAEPAQDTPLTLTATTTEGVMQVTLTWENSNSNVTTYRILRAPYDAFEDVAYEEIAVLDGSATEYVDTNVERFDSFYYVVEASQDGETVCSDPAFAYVEDKNPVFADIADLDKCIQKIFTANEERIISLAKKSINKTELAGGSDRYATMYPNCGPTSYGFQKVLLDTGIICELRRTPYICLGYNPTGHHLLMIRVNFGGDTSKVTNVLIDPTYRQFLRTDMGKACETSSNGLIDEAFEKSAFPDVFVYEYGNAAKCHEKLTQYRIESGFETPFENESSYNYITIGGFSYPLQEFTDAKSPLLTNAEYDLIRYYGTLDKPFEQDIFLDGSWAEAPIQLTYRNNGIYECYIPAADITENGSFTIVDSNGAVLYGASSASDELSFSSKHNYTEQSIKSVMYLNSTSNTALKLVYSSSASGYYIRIDMRAGIDAPSIVMFDARKSMYGDVNVDGVVDNNDVVLMQAYIAGEQQLDYFGKLTVNVFEAESITSDCVVDMQNYIAGLEHEGRTGQALYLVANLHIRYIGAPVDDSTDAPPIDGGGTEAPPAGDGPQEDIPQTGDSPALVPLIAIGLLALALIVVPIRRTY